MTQTRYGMSGSDDFNHGTHKDDREGGFHMDGDNIGKADERMMSELIDAYEAVEEDFDELVLHASALEGVATRAVDALAVLSEDRDMVLGITRDLNRARKDFAGGIIDLMVDLEEFDDIIGERIDSEIGDNGDDEETEDEDGIRLGINYIEIPIPPMPPEDGDETDPGYLSARLDFLTECLKAVTTSGLDLAVVLRELTGRVEAIENGLSDDDVDGGGKD